MVARKTVPLSPTEAGIGIDASGRVEVRARGWEQHFEVGMDAAVADGTTFIVFTNGLPAGTITIASGAGDFYINNNDQVLPVGVDPVCDMSTVEIRDGNNRVLLRLGDEPTIARLRQSVGGVPEGLWSRLKNLPTGQAIVSAHGIEPALLVALDPARTHSAAHRRHALSRLRGGRSFGARLRVGDDCGHHFRVEIQNLPVGNYDLLVGGLFRGTISLAVHADGRVKGERVRQPPRR